MSQVIDFKSGKYFSILNNKKKEGNPPFLKKNIGRLTKNFTTEQWQALSKILDFATNAEKTIIRQERRIDELEELSTLDDLTSLRNRKFLEIQISYALARSRRTGEPNILVYLDLNNFKVINDIYGHEAGDKMLKYMAKILTDAIRATDHAFRISGDEFAIIFSNSTLTGALRKTEKIIKILDTSSVNYQNDKLQISAAYGAVFIDHNLEIAQIMHSADLRMYKNKRENAKKEKTLIYEEKF